MIIATAGLDIGDKNNRKTDLLDPRTVYIIRPKQYNNL
jgi:hypothetical protein